MILACQSLTDLSTRSGGRKKRSQDQVDRYKTTKYEENILKFALFGTLKFYEAQPAGSINKSASLFPYFESF